MREGYDEGGDAYLMHRRNGLMVLGGPPDNSELVDDNGDGELVDDNAIDFMLVND